MSDEKKTWLEKVKEFEDKFNFSKINPEYINKNVFRVVAIIGLVLAILTVTTNGMTAKDIFDGKAFVYVNCPNTSLTTCFNPLWTCNQENTSIETVNKQYADLNVTLYTGNLTSKEEKIIKKTLKVEVFEPGCLIEYVNKEHKEICDQGGCKKFLNPGEKYGNEPNILMKNFGFYCLLLFIGAFFANDAAFRFKERKEDHEKEKEDENDN